MWDEKIEELEARREKAYNGGGQARIDKQHEKGKLTARERLDVLFDEGTFVEINSLMESRCIDFGMPKKKIPGDGVVTGYGKVNGRVVFASSQDFTVGGGALGEYHARKICNAMDMAMDARAPFVEINDSGGARIEEGIDSLNGYALMFRRHTQMSGVAPQIAVIMGPCAGGACYAPALCDYIFMTQENGQMYLTGPKVIKEVTGEVVTTSELGGAEVHMNNSGVAHFVYPDDESCLEGVKRLLSYLPENFEEKAPYVEPVKKYYHKRLRDIVSPNPKVSYDMHEIIEELADKDTFMEVQSGFAKNIIVGFMRMEGHTVGVVANQQGVFANYPEYRQGAMGVGGKLYRQGLIKMNEFVTLCARDRLPMIWIQDTTGIDVGNDAEKAELLGLGQSLIYSIQSSKLPMMEITLRRGTAAAHYVLGGPQGNDNNAFSLGTAATEINVMNGETAANAMYTGRLAKDQKAGKDLQPTIDKMNALINDYNEKSKPFYCAKAGLVDEIVDMPMMRNYIVAFTDSCYQNPESICPFHQMLLPRTIRDFETFKK